MSNITIVTAFFDIGRGEWTKPVHGRQMPHYIPRTTDTYFGYFENLSKIKNDMIIYTSHDFVDKIKEIREKNSPEASTHVVGIDLDEATQNIKPKMLEIMGRKEFVNLVKDPHMPEYWNADYVLINFMKTDFVNHAFENSLVKTELAAWIDFGYARDNETVPASRVWKYNFNPNKMHYFNRMPVDFDTPIFEIIRTNTVYIQGCHMVGGKEAWLNNMRLNYINLNSLLSCGLVDDDQTILLMNWRSDPHNIELHPIPCGDTGWYKAMTKFNEA
jgi:protein YibB